MKWPRHRNLRKPPRRGRLRPELFSVCLTMKLVGKPDVGNRHVRSALRQTIDRDF